MIIYASLRAPVVSSGRPTPSILSSTFVSPGLVNLPMSRNSSAPCLCSVAPQSDRLTNLGSKLRAPPPPPPTGPSSPAPNIILQFLIMSMIYWPPQKKNIPALSGVCLTSLVSELQKISSSPRKPVSGAHPANSQKQAKSTPQLKILHTI